MPTIDVDDEVFARLQAEAEPLVDTPNSVLRRRFGLPPLQRKPASPSMLEPELSAREVAARGRYGQDGAVSRTTPRKRLTRGKLLPEGEYELPILRALDQAGGSAPTGVVVDVVGEMLRDRLTDLEYEVMPSGEVRWRNRAQWARSALVRKGLLDPDSPWGTWTITGAGRAELARHRSTADDRR